MKPFCTEHARHLPCAIDCDVAVVGGGIAGVSAALAAARNGADVCLLEKEYGLGGLATLGNVVYYLPLCDGRGRQVIGGIGEELLKLSVGDNPRAIPTCWKKNGSRTARKRNRYRVLFNPAYFMLELERLALENRIRILYDTRFCAVGREGRRIRFLAVENKSGRSAIRCKTVVDATGDADVCKASGEETISLRTNVRAGWFYYFDGRQVRLKPLSDRMDPFGLKVPGGGRGYAGDDADDVTAQVVDTRCLIRQKCAEIMAASPRNAVCPLFLPSIPDLRMTRRLKGALELMESDERRFFPDTIGMTGDWRKSGPVYYLPLRCMLATRTDNLIAAGRCISAGPGAWDIVRAIPACAVTGQAAGTAAAMACNLASGALRGVPCGRLAAKLAQQGVIIDRSLRTRSN